MINCVQTQQSLGTLKPQAYSYSLGQRHLGGRTSRLAYRPTACTAFKANNKAFQQYKQVAGRDDRKHAGNQSNGLEVDEQYQDGRPHRNSKRSRTVQQLRLEPSPQQLNEFQALWRAYAQELQLSKETATRVITRVQQGILPCNARVIRTRAYKLLELEKVEPDIKPRYLLAHSSDVLRFSAQRIVSAARRLRKLLPDRDLPSLLVTLMPVLADATMDVLACELLELEHAINPIWKGAAVQPRLAALWLSQRALQYKQLDAAHKQQQKLSIRARKATFKAKPEQVKGEEQQAAPETHNQELNSQAAGPPGLVDHNSGQMPADDDYAMLKQLQETYGLSVGQASVLKQALQLQKKPVSDFLNASSQPDQEAESSDNFAATFTLADIQLGCQTLVDILGLEPAYTAVSLAPRLLLSLPPQQAALNFKGLQVSLKLAPAAAALLVESHPRLLAMAPDVITAQISGLSIALGWSRPSVISLCSLCPATLLTPPRAVSNSWRKMKDALSARPAWKQAVETSKVTCLAALFGRPNHHQSLARLAYLAQRPKDMRGVSWERVISMSQPDFLNQCPDFYVKQQQPEAI